MRLDEASRSSQRTDMPSALPADTNWRARRAGFFSAARLALLRAAHTRWLLLVVAIGILVADVLICTVPLYNTLVSDIQLQNAITSSDSLARNMQVAVRSQAISRSVQQEADSEVRQEADRYLTSFSAPKPTAYLTAGVMALLQAGSHTFGSPGDSAEARMQAFDYTALQPYLHFVAGAAPQNVAAGKPIQVMVTKEMADFLHLKVGQSIVVDNLGARGIRSLASSVASSSQSTPMIPSGTVSVSPLRAATPCRRSIRSSPPPTVSMLPSAAMMASA